MLASLMAYLHGLARRREIDAEAEDELQFHLEQQIETNIAGGMSAAEARRVALRDFGGLTQTRQAVREVRTIWLDAAGGRVADTGVGNRGQHRNFLNRERSAATVA